MRHCVVAASAIQHASLRWCADIPHHSGLWDIALLLVTLQGLKEGPSNTHTYVCHLQLLPSHH